jgi:hypothetical protein
MNETTTWSKGDRVILRCQQYGTTTLIATSVKSVSPTGQITLKSQHRFKANGREIGAESYAPHRQMLKPTPELEAALNRQQLLAQLKTVKWEKLSDDALDDIGQILAGATYD